MTGAWCSPMRKKSPGLERHSPGGGPLQGKASPRVGPRRRQDEPSKPRPQHPGRRSGVSPWCLWIERKVGLQQMVRPDFQTPCFPSDASTGFDLAFEKDPCMLKQCPPRRGPRRPQRFLAGSALASHPVSVWGAPRVEQRSAQPVRPQPVLFIRPLGTFPPSGAGGGFGPLDGRSIRERGKEVVHEGNARSAASGTFAQVEP